MALSPEQLIASLRAENASVLSDIQGRGAPWEFRLFANDQELIDQMQNTISPGILYRRTIDIAQAKFVPLVKLVLLGIFKLATEGQVDGAFPPEYSQGIQRVVLSLPPAKVSGIEPFAAYVEVPDLYEYLGSWDDFETGFHDRALLAGTSSYQARVHLPWSASQTLKTTSAATRYKAWFALYNGQIGYVNRKGTVVLFPEDSSWPRTVDERVRAWGSLGKAPQWLLLEYGQNAWSPKIVIPQGMGQELALQYRERTTYATGVDLGTGELFTKTGSFGSKSVSAGTLPSNITGSWVEALSQLWTEIIIGVWDQQVALAAKPNVAPTQFISQKQGYRPDQNVTSIFDVDYVQNAIEEYQNSGLPPGPRSK